ncbi:MAG: rRNA biogenesis protein rrp5 [Watsoniomyces obsoletus]|nr:MAG: rRNA biogenesis protein rrp5 [Watsoniomyces obsoletus]
MAYYQPTFLLGVCILLYLASFLLFALLRITTGISIQRLGYFSLRHIAYTFKDGVKVEVRSVGLLLHRPTFAQPTWLSFLVDELHITIDPESLGRQEVAQTSEHDESTAPSEDEQNGHPPAPHPSKNQGARVRMEARRSHVWKYMTDIKDRIKRVHQKINWLRMLDVVVKNSTATVVGVGDVQIGNLTLAVDVRRKFVDRTRLFHRDHTSSGGRRRPAEWTITIRSVLFKPTGKEGLEVLDQGSISVHGILHQDLNGLHDATIAIKCGRLLIPYDDLLAAAQRFHHGQRVQIDAEGRKVTDALTLTDVMEELDMPGTREENMMRTVSDSKEFVGSILRGIEEVQVAMSFVRLRKEIEYIQPAGHPLYLSASMKEVAMDLHRLDPRSPAHRMYFPSTDISHQALLAGIGFSIDVSDGHQAPERLVHVPMATATIKTTLPSKTFEGPNDASVADRNANIVFANIVVTSPSLDLDPRHLPMVLALVRSQPKPQKQAPSKHHLLSRLLPKASVKFSVHEPVIRVALPTIEPHQKDSDSYDLLISSISSIAVDVESFHSSDGQFHYSLECNLRIRSHQLYYQTASRLRYDLLISEILELKLQVSASPGIRVLGSGNIQTFSVHLVRPEISDGLRQIIQQLRLDVKSKKSRKPVTLREPNLIRRIPPWLLQFELTGSNFSVEVAGIDKEVSEKTRGMALQLESWSAEYRSQKTEVQPSPSSRRRTGRQSLKPDDALRDSPRASPAPFRVQNPTDGRRLAIHVHGLEGFVIDAVDTWESQPFLGVPRFEVAFSTSSDAQGPIFHVHAYIKTILIHYNLYRSYAIGIAAVLLKETFMGHLRPRSHSTGADTTSKGEDPVPRVLETDSLLSSPQSAPELVTIDVKAALVQIKACLPADPQMMLQIYNLDVGNHRWTSRHFKASLVRLLARAPQIPGVWARMICIKNPRFDYKEVRRKSGLKISYEKSIELSADAVRLAVPHQLIVYKIFDNIANATKATEQLLHRFRTGSNDYILEKKPQGPKRIPKISFRTKAFLLELEDGPFERKLAMIYRVGLVEQTQRVAREDAFHAKVNKLKEAEQKRTANRQSARPPNKRRSSKIGPLDEPDPEDERVRSQSALPNSDATRKLRYDREGKCGLSDAAKLSADAAWIKLQELNAQSWKKRIDWGLRFQRNTMKEIRGLFWEADELPDGAHETETILEYPRRPALMALMISDFRVNIDKPSFPIHEYPTFLHRIGKGMPVDMKYSLLIPTSLQLDMGETRMMLRDYPLPLVHIPQIRPTQSPRLPSWSLRTDFVIAEEFRDGESTRHVNVAIVPPSKSTAEAHSGGFAVDVRRTVSPVKTYSDLNIEIHTGHPTGITWATSYQPAIQDMMMVIETFTKPQLDPSERPGFWDKIRLSFHSRANISWTGDGDVHLMLKGSRDPYVVTGYGAGFVMCWRNDIKWRISQDEDPRKFMTVDSGEYVLAVPDYSHQARRTMDSAIHHGETASSTSSSFQSGALFKKVIMKLTGNVQWLAGLVFERNAVGGGRTFESIPHYDVIFKTPSYAKAPPGEVSRLGSTQEQRSLTCGQIYDALRGFRSQYIHLSLAVAAPANRNWSVSNLEPSANYNSVHLTPRFFTHFFNWWSLFSGVMSLPIRQGALWPGVEKTKKKFGRHLATIKYNLLLSPLFISHLYKHKDAEDYQEDLVSATGLKIKLDSFMIDLHQRREEFSTMVKGRNRSIRTSGMRINQAQVDFISADIRAISASIAGTTVSDLQRATEETLASYQQSVASVDMSRFTIPDSDFSWIDMDDFVELDWMLPAESNPETKIMPLAYAPRFTYFRQTDDKESGPSETTRSSRFGNESTHFCVMSPDNDPRRVQADIIKERLAKLKTQMDQHRRSLGEAELLVIRDASGNENLRGQHEMLKHHGRILEQQKRHLHSMLERISDHAEQNGHLQPPDSSRHKPPGSNDQPSQASTEKLESAPLTEYASDFQNRFIVHNAQIKWNNTLRNIILRYIHQVSQRRGFVYYLSRRAVKFILDIVDEQHKRTERPVRPWPGSRTASKAGIGEVDADGDVDDRIEQLLQDARKFVAADDPSDSEGTPGPSADRAEEQLAEDLAPQATYHVRLIAPQIQLQSEKNTSAAVLVTAKGIELKVIQVMDKTRMTDDVSGLVQRRFLAEMNNVQVFVTDRESFAAQFLPLFSGKKYGAADNSSWPPWVPLEIMFDFHIDPFGFSRVVQRTSASLRYDKYNTLRLKFNDEVSKGTPHRPKTAADAESQIDHIAVQFPQIKAVCDSSQYYAMYIMVLDLLLYSEPLEKVRSERLERIMLASDFSDLRGAPELVMRLQERIRQLEEIKLRFQINARYLDRQGWEDRLTIEQDLAGCEDELFFMLKAITTSQRRSEDRSDSKSNGLLRWNLSAADVVWHLMRGRNEPLIEFQLKDASFDRTDNSDGSNFNAVCIDRFRGFNLLPDAVYPEMIAPYIEPTKTPVDVHKEKMLRVNWHMLEAIAGIPILDTFEVNLFPLRIQLEREVGKRLFEYIFPGNSPNSESGRTTPHTPRYPTTSEEGSRASTETMGMSDEQALQKADGNGGHSRSLMNRLRPTIGLGDGSNRHGEHKKEASGLRPSLAGSNPNGERQSFRFLQSHRRSRSGSRSPSVTGMRANRSTEKLRMTPLRPTEGTSTPTSHPSGSTENAKRFILRRSSTKDLHDSQNNHNHHKATDDLTQMMARASSYMTLAYVKIPSVVLCLSYHGRGERNFEDLHDFVFRMPVIEYRNKTWSNLDLALHLKRDVIKALISHTGALIGNKLSHHRPSKQQQSRLREVAHTSSLLSTTADASSTWSPSVSVSDSSSRRESSPGGATSGGGGGENDSGSIGVDTGGASAARRPSSEDQSSVAARKSFTSDAASTMPRTGSYASSIWSAATKNSVLGGGAGGSGQAPSSEIAPSSSATTMTVAAEGNTHENHGFIHNTLTRHLPHHLIPPKIRPGSSSIKDGTGAGNNPSEETIDDPTHRETGSTSSSAKILGPAKKMLGKKILPGLG